MRRAGLLASICVGAALLAGSGYLLARPERPPQVHATLSLAGALGGGSDAGFARATRPGAIALPRDHGPHPAFRTEWWYYTGNLTAAGGQGFGFQLTFFRRALTARPAERSSAWAASQVYMAHFALSDIGGRRFHAFERLSRAAIGLAGATAEPFRVWVEDWSAEATGTEGMTVRLRAAAGDVAIDLTLRSAKPAVLQGDRGLSRKGAEPGNASYYYSLTRTDTRGVVTIGAAAQPVLGSGWMDREWGTTTLDTGQVGWDWFALQLADGREMMFYRLRRRDGSTDPVSRGSLVASDGASRLLTPGDVTIEPLDAWRSPRSGVVYPSRWRIRIPGEGLELEVAPHLPDQELDLAVRYWEGAVRVTGTAHGQAITGDGYVELTGYGDAESRASTDAEGDSSCSA